MRASVLFLALLCGCSAASAAVQVAPNGFVVRIEAEVDGSPTKVYKALVGEVSQWWNAAHTYSGDARNLVIDARPGGCFCERLPAGGGVEHLRVVNVQPPGLLRFSGALGPLQGQGLAGSLTFRMSPAPKGTRLELDYAVGGFMEGGLEKMAPAVDAMLAEQVGRLKRYIETGKPT